MASISKTSGIYIIKNLRNGKFYLGQTQNIRKRWNDHKSNLRKNTHSNIHLQRAWNIDGEKNFKFLVLEYCPVEQLDEREQVHLDAYVSGNNCYNIAKDATAPNRGRQGTMLGKHHTDATKRKISEAKRGKPSHGKKHTAETIQKMREIHRNISDETRLKMSEAKRGKPPHNKGKPASEGQKQKQREAMLGRPSPNRGKPMSEEQKQKLSEAAKRRYHKQTDEE
jgi:hypothetical protein